VVKSADARKCDDLAHLEGLDGPRYGCFLPAPEVGAVFTKAFEVGTDHPPELALVHRAHVVQAVVP
jgi:hypothetical protein